MKLPHEERLRRLARVAVEVGCRLKPGQELIVHATIDAVPLVREVTAAAYRAGASVVTPLFVDEQCRVLRFQHGHEGSFSKAPTWLADGLVVGHKSGMASVNILGSDPFSLRHADANRVAEANKARSIAYRELNQMAQSFAYNWTILSYAAPDWARTVFPDLSVEAAVEKLWDAIFFTCRVDEADPVESWWNHNEVLRKRRGRLNAAKFSAMHFKGGGTDLRVGLAPGHVWIGGEAESTLGYWCNPNIPTEEVFTTPDALDVSGVVVSTKPLAYQGTLIDGIELRFENGRAVEASARLGQEALRHMISTDETACRLGELALVPNSSLVSKSGVLFQNTLFDENAASHIALGNHIGIATDKSSPHHYNRSLIHVDWMIGSAEVDVDGIERDGRPVPVMRGGEWVE